MPLASNQRLESRSLLFIFVRICFDTYLYMFRHRHLSLYMYTYIHTHTRLVWIGQFPQQTRTMQRTDLAVNLLIATLHSLHGVVRLVLVLGHLGSFGNPSELCWAEQEGVH